MAAGTLSSTSTGYFSLLEAAVPDVPQTVLGVMLVDGEDALHVRMRRDLHRIFDDTENLEFFEALADDLETLAATKGGSETLRWLEDSASHGIRCTDREAVLVDNWQRSLNRLYSKHVPAQVIPFRTHLPIQSLRAAAGRFGETTETEAEGWVETPADLRLTDQMFVAHIAGRSMEPDIPDGSLCVFQYGVAGSRTGRLVLVEKYGEAGENRYTIKRYRRKGTRVFLEPLNPEFEAWEIEGSEAEGEDPKIRVLAEFIAVLE